MSKATPQELIDLINKEKEEKATQVVGLQNRIIERTNQRQFFYDQIVDINSQIQAIQSQIAQLNLEMQEFDEIITYIHDPESQNLNL